MKFSEPNVFHLAGLVSDSLGLAEYLTEIGADEWSTDAGDDTARNIEVAGRTCYRSWKPGMNENVTKVRKGNRSYTGNILEQNHTAVLEHSFDTYAVRATRVYTHEQVRHRVGIGYSQESLRYVRLTELETYFPKFFQTHPKAELFRKRWQHWFERCEDEQAWWYRELDINDRNFTEKKQATSSTRRLAPMGLMTSIVISSNITAFRHMIEQRTSPHAEEEIREVYWLIFQDQRARHPNLYQDAEFKEVVNGPPAVYFADPRDKTIAAQAEEIMRSDRKLDEIKRLIRESASLNDLKRVFAE